MNFTRFVEWPATALSGADEPFSICILGEDPFGPALDRMLEGERVQSRKLVVRRIRREQLISCQVLFAGRSEKELSKTLATLGHGVLTVGEGDDFLREGGMMAFVLENRRVRFDIKQSAATRAALRMSSKLLSVARSGEK